MINRLTGKAIHRYHMIDDGDRIVIGLSGGKDSLTLLSVLAERMERVPVTYRLFPVYIDPGFDNGFGEPLAEYCEKLGFPLTYERTDHGPKAHEPDNRVNPCFLCSRNRRKRLFEIAENLNCSKIALGHTKDDIIETLFINMLYSGQISTMTPAQPMFRNSFTVIRPLSFVDESYTMKFFTENSFPTFVNPCPSAGRTKRHEIKKLLQQIYQMNPNIKGNIFRSMSQVKEDYLLT